MHEPPVRRALISVSEKLGLADFGRALSAAGVEIFSTGGTRRHLESHSVAVRDVSQYTGFPEMMDGRLKTLHPKVFGGILCRHDNRNDIHDLREHGILSFELVVVNLYPFEATIARGNATLDEAIEQIDIGGPSLVRAAAKNHHFVTIATQPQQYSRILQEIYEHRGTSLQTRRELAAAAFSATAAYDLAISNYFAQQLSEERHPASLGLQLTRKTKLRYGENQHQEAALYRISGQRGANLVSARQLNGKELSFNNLLDLDAALRVARSFAAPAACVIKHTNPCGAATAGQLHEAMQKALEGDPVSAFGSVLGLNRTVDVATAEILTRPGLFIEAIVAPDYEAAAVGLLTTRPKWRNNVRLMQVGRLDESSAAMHFHHVDGGLLVQDSDTGPDLYDQWEVVTELDPPEALWDDIRFAWRLVRHVKSNAIVLCRDTALVGAGAGQMSRVDSVHMAARKAGPRAQGAVLASDAFFPFPDSIERAAEIGVAAIVQPGGSRQDEEVIAACNQNGIPMVLTQRRHFRH